MKPGYGGSGTATASNCERKKEKPGDDRNENSALDNDSRVSRRKRCAASHRRVSRPKTLPPSLVLRLEHANEVVDTIRAHGGQAIAIGADVSQEDDVQRLFEQAVDKFGSVDILVANAGIQLDATLTEMTLQQWDRVIAVNLTGQFLCSREAVRYYLNQGIRPDVSCAAGKIICISSVHQVIPWAGHVNYAASKGGVDMMMQSIAQEVAEHKIRVNSIAPGAIQTPINKSAWQTPEALNRLLELIPDRRIGQPQDIANAVVWLASDCSDYVHGTTLYVDGGMTLYPGFTENG